MCVAACIWSVTQVTFCSSQENRGEWCADYPELYFESYSQEQGTGGVSSRSLQKAEISDEGPFV
jgi:hypothetical protein